MMRIRPGRVDGRVRAPASKSHTHRAFILAALSGNGLVRNALRSDDTDTTLECLHAWGFLVNHEAAGTRVGGVQRPARGALDARESGTTLRLLAPVAALLDAATQFTGAVGLARRPILPLLEALRELGATAERDAAGFPIRIRGPFRGGRCRLPGDASSQYLSGLLVAAPLAPAEVRIELTSPLASRPYVDLTLAQLRARGVRVDEEASTFTVPAPQRLRQRTYDVPGDYSSAAFLLAAAAVTGGAVTVDGLPPDEFQGDAALLGHLASFGADVRRSDDSVTVTGRPLRGAAIDVGPTPDLFPVLCAVAAFAAGDTLLSGAPHLRHKESDRVHAMATNLAAFGVQAQEQPDGIRIRGGRPRGTTIQSFADHRVAMAGAVLALGAQGESRLPDPRVVHKSYPQFAADLRLVAPGVTV